MNLVNGYGPARGDRPGRPEGMAGGDWVAVGYLVAAWYCAATLAGMRPRPLTGMPLAFAHARISALR